MNLRLASLHAEGPGVCVAEFDRGSGQAPLVATFRVEVRDGIRTTVPEPDPFRYFDGTADELRLIIQAVVAFTRVSAHSPQREK